MISAQGDTEFEIPNYNELKKVYSIWICMNAPKYIGNAISGYSITKEDIVPGIPDKKSAYDKIAVVVICLNECREKQTEFLEMLNTLFSTSKSAYEKKKELEKTFGIDMKSKWKEMNLMCNLSEWVLEKGIKQGANNKLKEIVRKLLDKGMNQEEIAALLDESIKTIEEIIIEIQGKNKMMV